MLRRHAVYRRLGLAGCTLALAFTMSGLTLLPLSESSTAQTEQAATLVAARRQPDRRASRERPLPLKTPNSEKSTVKSSPTPMPRAGKSA